MSFSLSNTQKPYLTDQMNKVSRSFALISPQLESPLNDYLATAYLICRVVDNIEDCTQPFAWKEERFNEFGYLLKNPLEADKILAKWEQYSWPGLNIDEQSMMSVGGGLPLWEIYGQLPDQDSTSIGHWAGIMANGMKQVINPDQSNEYFISRDGIHLPSSELGYDQYCYFVAGTVGHMITELAIRHYGIGNPNADKLLQNSEASGRALQKTNIIKDFAHDLKRDACYLPDDWLREANYSPLRMAGAPLSWKKRIFDNILKEYDDSINYILNIPVSAHGFRKASLLMLLPGYQTLQLAAKKHNQLFTKNHDVKISRVTMGKCLLDANRLASSNNTILAYRSEIVDQLWMALESNTMRMTV